MLNKLKVKKRKYMKRKLRSKKHLVVTKDRPRLVVKKSNRYIYAIVVDHTNKVLFSVSSISKELRSQNLGKNVESVKIVGKAVADKLKSMNINSVVFDRNGYLYHGRVKALADACREAGIKL